ncbi:MAG: hypothetical protein CMJ38_00340 [Phycisphaerae bacterium]|nr:hypothetical protein [Phycisphaerae bacterium]|tara:strand:- start:891 stop:1826 length:936 start_codon:yes stop_codon:yes gene_type:complete
MVTNNRCIICESVSLQKINSYKHFWISCNDCGNIKRERKDKYLVPRFLPKFIAKIFFPEKALNKIYPMDEVIKNEKRFYDHYKEDSQLDVDSTKWAGESETIKNNLKKLDISVKNKNILDISGGPGFVALDLEHSANKVFVTEYSEIGVNGMKDNLGVNAIKFDYQNDKISQILNEEKFDIVLINFSINFCLDLKSFILDLKKILIKKSIVYISFVPPTLGCCLRWQHDEYVYNILYHPETMGRILSEAGFRPLKKIIYRRFGYLENMPLAKKLFLLPYFILYTILALRPGLSIKKELIQKDVLHIYEYMG